MMHEDNHRHFQIAMQLIDITMMNEMQMTLIEGLILLTSSLS